MGDVTVKDYEKIDRCIGWLNLPKAVVLTLFGIIDVLSEIRNELRQLNKTLEEE